LGGIAEVELLLSLRCGAKVFLLYIPF
jgi:hypothetical protein